MQSCVPLTQLFVVSGVLNCEILYRHRSWLNDPTLRARELPENVDEAAMMRPDGGVDNMGGEKLFFLENLGAHVSFLGVNS